MACEFAEANCYKLQLLSCFADCIEAWDPLQVCLLILGELHGLSAVL